MTLFDFINESPWWSLGKRASTNNRTHTEQANRTRKMNLDTRSTP